MANEEGGSGLKEKLQEHEGLVEGEDSIVDEAIRILATLKDLELSASPSLNLQGDNVPPQFLCPISGELTKDPVMLSISQVFLLSLSISLGNINSDDISFLGLIVHCMHAPTYDRPSIKKWLSEIKRVCPESRQVLSHAALVPISMGSDIDDGEKVTNENRYRLHALLYQLSVSSLFEQRKAAKELQQITRRTPSFIKLPGNPEVLHLLLSPLSSAAPIDSELHEDLLRTVMFLSENEDNNKVFAAENEKALSLVIYSLKSGTMQTRLTAARVISSLSLKFKANRDIIGGNPLAIKFLVELLKVAESFIPAIALINLCIFHDRNKKRVICEGVMQFMLSKITDCTQASNGMLLLVTILSTDCKGAVELGRHGISPILDVLRNQCIPELHKESCLGMLSRLCFTHRNVHQQLADEENTYRTFSNLSESATSKERVREYARAIVTATSSSRKDKVTFYSSLN
ncbi:hypothetical protein RJT34_23653 [Clitoria ternatea]|uniref:RING-type E3 ubiquitin transferase n=1 Tax=Clitoria ternatea TaxID=43366 RepID=A0AAN9IIL8_CLITE